ncbi:hypothetical protein LINPERPRIM_LOCUS31224 [Linum perenne]
MEAFSSSDTLSSTFRKKKVYMGVCFPIPSRVVIRTEATIFMMKFISQLLRQVYAKHGSIDKCPSISDFQLEVPCVHLYPPAKNKHDSGLWVCTWIAVDSKDPFRECGCLSKEYNARISQYQIINPRKLYNDNGSFNNWRNFCIGKETLPAQSPSPRHRRSVATAHLAAAHLTAAHLTAAHLAIAPSSRSSCKSFCPHCYFSKFEFYFSTAAILLLFDCCDL